MTRLGVGLFAAFLVLTVLVVAGWTQALDDVWLSRMEGAGVSWLVTVAEAFDVIGGFLVALATSIAIGVAFIIAKKWWALVAWVAIVGGAQVLSAVAKTLVDRPRPIEALVYEPSAAYPSGHAAVSGAAMAIGLALILGFVWPHLRRHLIAVAVVYAVVMAWSRTYLLVHWLTDVIGGLFLGTAVVLIVSAAVSRRVSQKDPTRSGDPSSLPG